MSRFLAIDYGKKRSGIAVTDPLNIIVTPLETVETENIFSFLYHYFQNEEVQKVIIGYPLDMDDNRTDNTDAVERFAKKFNKKFPKIPTDFEDERMTSKMAAKALVEGGFKKKKRQEKGSLDKISAVFILKSYLDMD